VGRKEGASDDKLEAIADWVRHPGFTARERAALALAEMVTISPTDVTDEMFAETRRHLSEREVVEVVAQAAFENFRARLTRTLRVEADGFATMPRERLPRVMRR
jgi:alkylhydroperoxidase family enzyme